MVCTHHALLQWHEGPGADQRVVHAVVGGNAKVGHPHRPATIAQQDVGWLHVSGQGHAPGGQLIQVSSGG